MRKILFSFLFVCLCPLLALAQDVIVKRDRSAVICRIVEVGNTEVVYKRWSDLQGNNYVMNIADITAIHYENGRKLVFDDNNPEPAPTQTPTQAQTQAPAWTNPNRQMGEMNDAQLLNLARKNDWTSPQKQKKVKNLKIAAWTVGPLAVIGGIATIFASREYFNGNDAYYFDDATTIPGSFLIIGGVATTTGCLIRAHNLKKRMVQSTPIYGHDFQFKNGSALSTNICSLTDGRSLIPSLGLGFNYNF